MTKSTSNRLLIVDDDPSIVETLGAVLKREGYEVWSAYNKSELLPLVKKQEFDVAIVDLRLGEGDGIDTLNILQTQQPDCFSIMLTGYASLESAVAALRNGAYAYLFKPCDLDELKLTVKGAASRSAFSRSLRQHLDEQRDIQSTILQTVEDNQKGLERLKSELEQKVRELAELQKRFAEAHNHAGVGGAKGD